MLAVLIIGYIMLHLTIGGVAYAKIQAHYRPTCKYLTPNYNNCDSDCGHSFLAGAAIPLWPVILPAMVGVLIGDRGCGTKIERRHAKEIEEAQHQKELARIRMEEDAMLNHQLASIERKR